LAKRFGGVTGIINLSQKDGSLYKRTLICHTGLFDAMYGPVEITKDKLDRVATRYNEQHLSVQNDADYAPVLVDHMRQADLIKGRVMPDLEVDKWTDPDDGTEGWGLYGTLRIDDEDAKNKVEGANGQNKKYAHVSMSFDDERTYELFEVSFVAVEAARRAIVLSNGGKPMSTELQAQLKAAELKRKQLAKRMKEKHAVRKAAHLALGENMTAADKDTADLSAGVMELVTKMKTSSLQATFKNFVREGRLTKAEFDKLEFADLAAMGAKSLKAILGSYASRPVSADVRQHGQTGAQPMTTQNLSAADMRALAKAQKEGKAAPTNLAEGEDPDPKAADKGKEGKGKEGGSESEMGYDDMEEVIKHCEGLGEIAEKLKGKLKKLSEDTKKLTEEDGDDVDDEGAE